MIEDSKLVSYALNPQSERGRHKARVFESTLGFNLSNWEQLKKQADETFQGNVSFLCRGEKSDG